MIALVLMVDPGWAFLSSVVMVLPVSSLPSMVPVWCSSGPTLVQVIPNKFDMSRRSRQILMGLVQCYWASFVTS